MSDLSTLRGRIHGPVFSVITPFRADESIDYPALRVYLKRIFDAGGRVFYVMAYNSRYSELSWEEIKELNKFVVETVKSYDGEVTAIVGDPLHCSTRVSMEFCRHAKSIGADLISLIFREKFYSHEQVIRHYEMCSSSVDIGILIHEMPFISGKGGDTVNWPLPLLDRIADIENVIAIKEDAKDDTYSREVIDCLKGRLAIVISGGGKRQWLRFAERGCQAWLNGIGVFEPKLATRFYHAYLNGKNQVVDKIIQDIEVPFFEDVVRPYGWHLGIKAALEARGVMGRNERMPLLELSDADMERVRSVMKTLDAPIKEVCAE